ncbi:hypothetical protein F2Q70_00018385 [Brassica cretica]|uniref:Uncharacterized protein n=1 Tax=Brassica cretica TaxID=69181 RepID=A0A8S9HS54_BRACR|nr:hypothetical protein F2Q70_00018385 [Brassica cretica]KAF2600692.1 hypothetical protein F2Q68_00011670 [Brassica cretica]
MGEKLERGERINFSLYSLPTDSFFSEALFCSVFRWRTVPSTVGRHPTHSLVSRLFSCLTVISYSLLAQRLWISDELRPDPSDLSGRQVCTRPPWSIGDAVIQPGVLVGLVARRCRCLSATEMSLPSALSPRSVALLGLPHPYPRIFDEKAS